MELNGGCSGFSAGDGVVGAALLEARRTGHTKVLEGGGARCGSCGARRPYFRRCVQLPAICAWRTGVFHVRVPAVWPCVRAARVADWDERLRKGPCEVVSWESQVTFLRAAVWKRCSSMGVGSADAVLGVGHHTPIQPASPDALRWTLFW